MNDSTTEDPDVSAAPSSVIVIFGGGGDLTKRKLVPALYHLAVQGLLPEAFAVMAVDRAESDDETFRGNLEKYVREFTPQEFSEQTWSALRERIHYSPGDFRDPEAYEKLSTTLDQLCVEKGVSPNYLFYLATPPSFFGIISDQLGAAGLSREPAGAWRRIIIEKPFGRDLQSARALNDQLHQTFQEPQIYRIDHYLGKETVQNILAYRFSNSTVEPIWNHRYIDHVQITVVEDLGVENRAVYYEEAGALRDMIPNHLLAVLSVIAMEPPNSFDADEVRDEQSKVLRAIQPLQPEEVLKYAVRGQYGAGTLQDGSRVPAYRSEPGIDSQSATETYIALRLQIDSWRWAGIPFYIRTGKRMMGRFTEVVVQYRDAPNQLFRDTHRARRLNIAPNRLVLRIQPNEGIGFGFNAKIPGKFNKLGPVQMDFRYRDYFGDEPSTGYETLIYDCLCGDATLFKRADNIESGWSLVQPIIDVWQALPPRDFPNYVSGTWGPSAADDLLAREGRHWINSATPSYR
ncbi:MAG: glucose-6-phosphate dehydrogenase [Gammaproteobacteria bacterium]|jgi:glucose-6-phosphate 1-dehydrogenase|nr:glucose-6-phosphate dehydrogenase [Gammaproteobacteria bacterium]